ncbi:MAG: phosphoglucosamine mutase, partial [Bacteroidia bacterium]|nr:phosphoglucosamine mutase [Bacteroidia bacterium]NNM16095.1 phosphoglucosamine mutase [Bacteroidia bacterium]
MPLIKSISGIRGTIGGEPGSNFTPLDVVQFSAAYAYLLKEKTNDNDITVVIGRDARPSGPMVQQLVTATLNGCGINVIDLGLSTTPTVEMAVVKEKANGGIILTASHNPVQWNALKLLNEKGEFISGDEGKKLLELIEENKFDFNEVDSIGSTIQNDSTLDYHYNTILELPLVDKGLIEKQNFKVVVDGVNSSGGIAVPEMLRKLGVKNIVELNCKPDGKFSHNP